MSKKILIDAVHPGETRVVIYDKNNIQDFDYENKHHKQLKGNIYSARITRVEPSLQAAFIEYGGDKHGFLPFNEIHPSYFNVEGNQGQERTGKTLEDKIPFITLSETSELENESTDAVSTEKTTEDSTAKVEDKAIAAENPVTEIKETKEGAKEETKEEAIAESEESESEESSKHFDLHQKYKIQDVMKKGQVLLIQVNKEERGNKGAACTTYISLAGRYCVLMPNSDRQGGISRRIQSHADRKRLKDVLNSLALPEGVSIILRTAGAGRNPNDIRRDYYYLARLWNAIREYAMKANINSFIHAESDLLKRTIRDLYSSEVAEIQIQGNESYKSAKEFMKKIMPLHAHKVKEYRARLPIFTKYNIEEQISNLYAPIAIMPSGGYIVINPTEALIAVDVNSGKATNERNIEETATKTNVEAAIEVARQLRLRNMSGLIVIDFIDMVDSNNRRLVERTLRDAFQTDRAKVQLGNISAFGLLELSRQRLQSSFIEANTIVCPSCKGKGHIKSFDTSALVMLRAIESEIHKGDCQNVTIFAHPDVIIHVLNSKREQLTKLETKFDCKILFTKEDGINHDGFGLEKTIKDGKAVSKSNAPKFNEEDHFESYGEDVPEIEVSEKEAKLGLGEDLAPYQVNSDEVMSETVDTYKRNNRDNKFRKGYVKRRKISGSDDSQSDRQPALPSTNQPALIYQQEGGTNPNQRRRNNNNRRRIQGKHRPNTNGNNGEKKSMLQSWWKKLID